MKRGTSIFALPHFVRLSREMKKFQSLDLHSENGRTDLTLRAKRKRGTFVRQMAALMAAWFYQEGGQNYVEVEFTAPVLNEEIPPGGTRRIGPLILTVQRKEGETPHALRRKAEVERDAALQSVVKVYPVYNGGHDPLSLVAGWNALHPDRLLVPVNDAFVTCQAYLVTGHDIEAQELAQEPFCQNLPERPVLWLENSNALEAFVGFAAFRAGRTMPSAQLFPQKPNETEVHHVA